MKSASRTVYLVDMDGFEFESLCKTIFEQLGYGRVELLPPVGDGGRDLIIHEPQGNTVVECKHQPKTSIGRPIIQKLHSAVISEGARKGIVVTTGKFSRQAIEHAANLRPEIELIDIAMLRDLASRAGIYIVSDQESAPIHTYQLLSTERVNGVTVDHLSNKIVSHPATVKDAYSSQKTDILLRPVYRVRYGIDAEFSTSVGIVHTERSNGQFFIDGSDGKVISGGAADYFSSTPVQNMLRWDNMSSDTLASDQPFRILASTVKEIATDSIIRKHTRIVRYTGRNNQRYSKECTPLKKDIFIGDVSQEYIPEYQINYLLLGRAQRLEFANNGTSSIHILNDSTSICPICKVHVKQEKMSLCNECGLVTCTKKYFFKKKRHALKCDVCSKTLCPNCASYTSRMLFLKTILCEECANDFTREGKQVKKLIRA